jgi:diguanylate cyclase (GGDEF)-like protein
VRARGAIPLRVRPRLLTLILQRPAHEEPGPRIPEQVAAKAESDKAERTQHKQGTMTILDQIKELYSEPPDYLARRFHEHLFSSGILFIIMTFVGAGFWFWDYVVDPANAEHTLKLRLSFLLCAITTPIIFYFKKKYVFVVCFLFFVTIGCQTLLIKVLDQLDSGYIYGTAGFLYATFFAPLFLRPLSLRLNYLLTITIVLYPQLYGLVFKTNGFDQLFYILYIWPGAFIAFFTETFFAITDIKQYYTELSLEKAANTDALTGVCNRRHFMNLLSDEIARGDRYNHKMCLLMLDIDHFKNINDDFGHPTGDLTLQHFAGLCRQSARKTDTIARIGGEEFAILLPETGTKGSYMIAERIRSTIEQSLFESTEGNNFNITVSIGLAERNSTTIGEEDIINLADNALYEAKTSGRNRIVCA